MNVADLHSALAEPIRRVVEYKRALNRKYRPEAAALRRRHDTGGQKSDRELPSESQSLSGTAAPTDVPAERSGRFSRGFTWVRVQCAASPLSHTADRPREG
jgi:hypothetical protein